MVVRLLTHICVTRPKWDNSRLSTWLYLRCSHQYMQDIWEIRQCHQYRLEQINNLAIQFELHVGTSEYLHILDLIPDLRKGNIHLLICCSRMYLILWLCCLLAFIHLPIDVREIGWGLTCWANLRGTFPTGQWSVVLWCSCLRQYSYCRIFVSAFPHFM